MAKTTGHGNAPWTREETILALDLFLKAGHKALLRTDHRVIELSNYLRSFPENEQRARAATFRNAYGVAFKLLNLQALAIGTGFSNVSSMDRQIWHQLGHRRSRVSEIAEMIRMYAPAAGVSTGDDEDPEEFIEGRSVTRIHKRLERHPQLRKSLIKKLQSQGPLSCEICHATSPFADPKFGDTIFEAHHLRPLFKTGKTATRLTDVSLLCANCHRVTHRLIASLGRWVTMEEVRLQLDNGR